MFAGAQVIEENLPDDAPGFFDIRFSLKRFFSIGSLQSQPLSVLSAATDQVGMPTKTPECWRSEIGDGRTRPNQSVIIASRADRSVADVPPAASQARGGRPLPRDGKGEPDESQAPDASTDLNQSAAPQVPLESSRYRAPQFQQQRSELEHGHRRQNPRW